MIEDSTNYDGRGGRKGEKVKTSPNTTPWFPAGLIEDLEGLLGRKVEVVTENALHWCIRGKFMQEAVPI